ncbi:response regulator transcription factor [Paradesulfitobacterium ferrireducens]|uniref:response regulator transcription factor n=1 Tax=Paradesulfitobacterium ferrireducens TaxID=2816476 RepID=UPI001A8E0CE8|nr:response regulator [Paradesulfitobacterium ferrireducens]
MAQETILIVDDEIEIAELIEIYLRNEGYNIFQAHHASEALHLLEQEKIHLVILDIMMPGIDGLELCRRIRKELNTPIIMLSAKSEDMDIIMGLSTGADDYMTKPFNPLELMARVKSQLRRYFHLGAETKENNTTLSLGNLTLDIRARRVTVEDRDVSLTPTEFDILQFLMENRGMVLSTERIFEKVWREKYFESNNTVMVHIRKLREKIEKDPRRPAIKTVWGVGYKLDY